MGRYSGKSLSGEQALEKSLIIALGWVQPVSFFSCPDRLAAPVMRCGLGQGKSAAGEIQTQVTLGAASPYATSAKGPCATVGRGPCAAHLGSVL